MALKYPEPTRTRSQTVRCQGEPWVRNKEDIAGTGKLLMIMSSKFIKKYTICREIISKGQIELNQTMWQSEHQNTSDRAALDLITTVLKGRKLGSQESKLQFLQAPDWTLPRPLLDKDIELAPLCPFIRVSEKALDESDSQNWSSR